MPKPIISKSADSQLVANSRNATLHYSIINTQTLTIRIYIILCSIMNMLPSDITSFDKSSPADSFRYEPIQAAIARLVLEDSTSDLSTADREDASTIVKAYTNVYLHASRSSLPVTQKQLNEYYTRLGEARGLMRRVDTTEKGRKKLGALIDYLSTDIVSALGEQGETGLGTALPSRPKS